MIRMFLVMNFLIKRGESITGREIFITAAGVCNYRQGIKKNHPINQMSFNILKKYFKLWI